MKQFIDTLAKLPSPAQMNFWDKEAENFGISSVMLMENAGRSILNTLKNLHGSVNKKVFWIFAGSGNNGGDGFCLARHLTDAGAKPVIFHSFSLAKLAGASKTHCQLAMSNNVPFIEITEYSNKSDFLSDKITSISQSPHYIIDCLLGTGFSGQLKASLEIMIKSVNELSDFLRCPVISIDIPSGLNGITGNPEPVAIKADTTITLVSAKPGIVLSNAKKWTGKVYTAEIGMPKAVIKDCPASQFLLDGKSLLQNDQTVENSYKNIYGHIVIFGGSNGFEGAAHLACTAALKTGAGLITACAPQKNLEKIKNNYPEIMTFSASTGYSWPDIIPAEVKNILKKSNAIAIGPGMGKDDNACSFLQSLLMLPERPPAVIDADALAMLAGNPQLFQYITQHDILTPHPGEAAAILKTSSGQIQKDRFLYLHKLIDFAPCTFVLKGASTLIGQKGMPNIICPYDIPQLAIGGAGDVLCGCAAAILGSALYQGQFSINAAAIAVITHAMAGLKLAITYNNRGFLASDLAKELPFVKNFLQHKSNEQLYEILTPWPQLN